MKNFTWLEGGPLKISGADLYVFALLLRQQERSHHQGGHGRPGLRKEDGDAFQEDPRSNHHDTKWTGERNLAPMPYRGNVQFCHQVRLRDAAEAT